MSTKRIILKGSVKVLWEKENDFDILSPLDPITFSAIHWSFYLDKLEYLNFLHRQKVFLAIDIETGDWHHITISWIKIKPKHLNAFCKVQLHLAQETPPRARICMLLNFLCLKPSFKVLFVITLLESAAINMHVIGNKYNIIG